MWPLQIHTSTHKCFTFKTQVKHKGAPFTLVWSRKKRNRHTVFQCDTFLHLRQRNKGHNNFPGRAFHFYNTHLPYFKTCFQLCSQAFLLFGLSVTFYCFFDYMLYHCRLPLWVRPVWNLSACSRQVVQPAISSCSEAVPQLHTRACSIFHFNVSGERNKLSCLSCLGTQIYSLSHLLQRVV